VSITEAKATLAVAGIEAGLNGLYDSHCHLDLPELVDNWQQHWQQAQKVGVQRCLIPAVAPEYWPNLLQWRQHQPQFRIALGIHPWWAVRQSLAVIELLAQQLQQHGALISAVGEIGLDFAIDSSSFHQQQQLFSAQLALAKRFDKPLILHHRKSMVQLLAELKQQQFLQGGILHAFSGSPEQGREFVKLGFKLGIGGTITYDRSRKTQQAVRQLPLSAFVLETDAPSMPLAGFQGQVNTPAQLCRVFSAFCQLRAESPAEIAQQLWCNTVEVLGD
jgi:TatD DNase family protein